MLLIPAIDLKDGHCVRLKQGDMEQSTTFGEDEFFTGGLSIRATVDPEMQVIAAAAAERVGAGVDRGAAARF